MCLWLCVWKGKGTKANQNKSNTNTWRIFQVSRACGHSVRFCGAIKDAKDSFAHGLNLANRLISGTACVRACVCVYLVYCIWAAFRRSSLCCAWQTRCVRPVNHGPLKLAVCEAAEDAVSRDHDQTIWANLLSKISLCVTLTVPATCPVASMEFSLWVIAAKA